MNKLQMVFVSVPPAEKHVKLSSMVRVRGKCLPGEKLRCLCLLGDACPHREGLPTPDGDEHAEIAGEAPRPVAPGPRPWTPAKTGPNEALWGPPCTKAWNR